jgi:hypothetical protein
MSSSDDLAPRQAGLRGRLKDMALFFAAPFITLWYAAALPFAAIRLLRQGGAKSDRAELPAQR